MSSVSAAVESLETTAKLAWALVDTLRPGSVLCLDGDLGAGKTAFVRALAETMHATEPVTSPTFTLENRYPLAQGPAPSLVHVDLYRCEPDKVDDLLNSMLEARAEGLLLAVEWADPVKDALEPYLRIHITLEPDRERRRIRLTPVPEGWKHLARLEERWATVESAS